MHEIQAVIFDMDGVIFDTESLWKQCFKEANRDFNLCLSEAYRQSTCGKSEALIRQELSVMLPELDVDAYRSHLRFLVQKGIESGDFETKAGFLELVSYLRKRGCKLALATSSDRNRAEGMFRVKGLDLARLFDATVYSDEVGSKSKPDPFMFTLAAEKLGIAAENCVVAEDSVNGIAAAKNGGFIPAMVIDLIPPDDYCRQNCRWIVSDLTELKERLEGVR